MYAIQKVKTAVAQAINEASAETQLAVALLQSGGFAAAGSEMKKGTWAMAAGMALALEESFDGEAEERMVWLKSELTSVFGRVKEAIQAEASARFANDLRLTLAMPTRDKKGKERDNLTSLRNRAVKTLTAYDATIRRAWDILGSLPCDTIVENGKERKEPMSRATVEKKANDAELSKAKPSIEATLQREISTLQANILPHIKAIGSFDLVAVIGDLAGMVHLALDGIAKGNHAIPDSIGGFLALLNEEAEVVARIAEQTRAEEAAKFLEESLQEEQKAVAVG